MKLRGASVVAVCLVAAYGANGVRAAGARLEVATGRIAVSPPGHRISEYVLAQDPADPLHMVTAGMDWDHPSGGVGCGTSVSRDGGRTWREGDTIPNLDDPHAHYDPWVSVDARGRAHLICQDFVSEGLVAPPLPAWESPTKHFKYARSDDGGDTWNPAVRPPLRAPNHTTDKHSIHAASDGRVYICADSRNDLIVIRSDDGGDTWNPPVALDADAVFGNEFANCNGIVEGPAGEIYVNLLSIGGTFPLETNTVWGTIASFDHGETWQHATLVTPRNWSTEDFLSTAGPQYPAWTWPSLAVSPRTGHLIGAIMQFDGGTKTWFVDVYRSVDRGASYQRVAHPVPAPAFCARCHETRPSMAFDGEGRLVMTVSMTTDGGLAREQWVLATTDEAASWLDPVPIATSGPVDNADQRHRLPQDPGHVLAQAGQLTDADDMDAGLLVLENSQDDHHLTYGGDYAWGTVPLPDGFFVTWNDRAEGGLPRIWGALVRIG